MLTVEVNEDNALTIRVTLHGDITPDGLLSADDPLVSECGNEIYKRRVIVDCHDIDAINSAGISWMLNSDKAFREHDGAIVFYCLPPRVAQALRLISADRALQLADNERQARQLVQG